MGLFDPKRRLTPLDQERDFATKWKVEVWPIGHDEPETMEMEFTWDQFNSWYSGDELIQNALPHLTNEQREFLLTGLDQAAWDKLWKD